MLIQSQVKAPAVILPESFVPERRTLYDLFNGALDAEALHQQVVDLQERVNELEAFAHTVAHSLKGSLGALIGFAVTLKEDEARLTVEQRQVCLDYLVRSGYKLNSIVDELLLLAEMRQTDV